MLRTTKWRLKQREKESRMESMKWSGMRESLMFREEVAEKVAKKEGGVT